MAPAREEHSGSLSRRDAIRGAMSLGFLVLAGVAQVNRGAAAASGQLAGASLAEVATFSGWRQTWDLIVPVSTARSLPRTFILYDRAAGEAALMSIDTAGALQEIRRMAGWRGSWQSIIPSGFPRISGVTGLISYDASAGLLMTRQIDQFGNVQDLVDYPTWRKSWTAFTTVGAAGFLAYDRDAGFATLFAVDNVGVVTEITSYNDWRATWDLITTGPFTTSLVPSGDLLFYDRAARQAEGMTFQGTGQLTRFADYSGWRSTWTSVQGGQFSFLGYTEIGNANLMLFDQGAQELEFISIGAGSLLTSLLLTPTPALQGWSSATALGPDLILLYDRAAGLAGFYATDRAPAPPTPTPVPPAPTPTAVPIVQSGTMTLRLQQGGGNNWHTYTEKASNPKTGPGQETSITSVKNTADKRIALIHRDTFDKRTGPVFVKAGETVDAFNGMAVAGEWEARISTGRSSAPARIPIEIRYDVR